MTSCSCVSAHGVGLSDHGDAVRDSEQLADGQMLHRLRHDALVGRDDEHDCRHATGAGEHVADEVAVPGNVDEADAERRSVRRLRFKGSESEVDGDAAALLFGKPIGVNAGQGANQRRLAVVDMAGGSDDDRSGRIRHSEGSNKISDLRLLDSEAAQKRSEVRIETRRHGPQIQQNRIVRNATDDRWIEFAKRCKQFRSR